jgi:ABC-type glycerol-3-phosphate transport system substrate-binding protein
MKRLRLAVAGAVLASLTLTACGDDGGGSDKIEGEILVLTQRTDIVDTVFQEYKQRFEAKYPDVTVTFEAITAYETEVQVRLNTPEYGDVLLIPNTVTPDQLSTFFEPLGSAEELSQKYRFIYEKAYQGTAYGLALGGNASGFVYNKKVWESAGITEPPTTPEEFVEALQAIKDNTDAIPLYTNYKDGWPLTQWQGNRGSITADPEFANKLAHDDAPWSPGKDQFVIDSLIYDIVEAGLIEEDPTTTNWENSKVLVGTGQAATAALGSWAVSQFRQAAQDAGGSADDIGYLPFPTQVGGTFHSTIGGDYQQAVSIHSEHKAAAKAWVTWFVEESGYAQSEGIVPTLISGANPDTLADFTTFGVEYIELVPAPPGEEGLTDRIDAAAEIGLWGAPYRQRIVDAARGASGETKEQIFADLNAKWAAAKAATS